MCRLRNIFSARAIFVTLSLITGLCHAQIGDSYRVSRDSASLCFSEDCYKLTPDEKTVVYLSALDGNGNFELYSAPITGGTSTKLHGSLRATGQVFEISADGQRVVYISSKDGVKELYSVPITGGSAVKLVGGLMDGGFFQSFQISSDDQHVVYIANQDNVDITELYSVPITGGSIRKLNGGLSVGEDIFRFFISPDGQNVVYVRADSGNVWDLYSVRITGGAINKLNGDLTGRGIMSVDISPDSQHVVYEVFRDIGDAPELNSVGINGGSVAKLIGVPDALDSIDSYQISSDSTRVIYAVDDNKIYSQPISGGPRIKLTPDVFRIFSFKVSPDSQRVVYDAVESALDTNGLYSVPIAGGLVSKLNHSSVNSERITGFKISPGSQFVVYRTGSNTLYSVRINANLFSFRRKLTPNIASDRVIRSFRFSPDSLRVIYKTDKNIKFVDELYSVGVPFIDQLPVPVAVKLNEPLPSFPFRVSNFKLSSDGNFVIYSANPRDPDTLELFVHQLKGEPFIPGRPDDEPYEELCLPIKAKNGKAVVVCL